jgi:hypothetical protein
VFDVWTQREERLILCLWRTYVLLLIKIKLCYTDWIILTTTCIAIMHGSEHSQISTARLRTIRRKSRHDPTRANKPRTRQQQRSNRNGKLLHYTTKRFQHISDLLQRSQPQSESVTSIVNTQVIRHLPLEAQDAFFLLRLSIVTRVGYLMRALPVNTASGGTCSLGWLSPGQTGSHVCTNLPTQLPHGGTPTVPPSAMMAWGFAAPSPPELAAACMLAACACPGGHATRLCPVPPLHRPAPTSLVTHLAGHLHAHGSSV